MTLTTVEVADTSGFRRDPAELFFLERYGAARKAELAAFVDSMTSGAAPRLADQAVESVAMGLPVKV